MSKSNLFSVLLLSTLLSALPSSAEYAPLRIGNSWTYNGSVRIETLGPSGTVAFREYLEVRVVRQDGEPGDGGEVLWTVEMRDSLFNREMADHRTGQPVNLADTVIVLRLVLREVGNSIALVPGDPPSLPEPFFHPSFASSLLSNPLFPSRQPPTRSTPVQGAGGGRAVLETAPYGDPLFPNRTWVVDGVGLFWMEMNSVGADCSRMRRILVLETFNGMPVDIGIPTPSGPLSKEAKISCSIIRRKGMGAPVLRLGGSPGTRAFDLRGRLLKGVSGR